MEKGKVTFILEPEEGRKGVPIRELEKVLSAFQSALLKIGEFSITGKIQKERKRLPDIVLSAYNLEIVSFSTGSLEVNAVLPVADQQSILYKPREDLNKLVEVIDKVAEGKDVLDMLPDTYLRRKVLNSLKEMSSNKRIKSLSINNINVSNGFRDYIHEITMETTTDEEREIIGTIVELKIVDSKYFGIQLEKQTVRIPLNDDIIDEVISNVAKVVTIRGLVEKKVDSNEFIIKEVIDLNPLESDVFEIDYVEFKDKRLLFSKQIPIKISFKEDLWILENEKLEILAYGETFDLAWSSFREDLIFIWELLGKEKDSKLDDKAIEIKRNLEDLVVSEESLSG